MIPIVSTCHIKGMGEFGFRGFGCVESPCFLSFYSDEYRVEKLR